MNIQKINNLITELSGKKEFSNDSELKNEIGLNSLSMVLLLIRIEEIFNITLKETDLNPTELLTIRDVENLVNKYVTTES